MTAVQNFRAHARRNMHQERARRTQAGLAPSNQEPPALWNTFQQMSVGGPNPNEPQAPPISTPPPSIFSQASNNMTSSALGISPLEENLLAITNIGRMRQGINALTPAEAAPLLVHQRSQARGNLGFEAPRAVQPFDFNTVNAFTQRTVAPAPQAAPQRTTLLEQSIDIAVAAQGTGRNGNSQVDVQAAFLQGAMPAQPTHGPQSLPA